MERAWEQLIEHFTTDGVLKTPEILDAFKAIDRKDFVPSEQAEEAYADYPLPIGFGQTISQPYTVAFMLELLEPRPGQTVLDVGSGSGWTTALLGHIIGPEGKVFATELVPELVAMSKASIQKYQYDHIQIKEAQGLGLHECAPYDRILVSAADSDLPQELVDQLRIGGIMVIPVSDALWKVTRTQEDETDIQKFAGFAFVPLIHD